MIFNAINHGGQITVSITREIDNWFSVPSQLRRSYQDDYLGENAVDTESVNTKMSSKHKIIQISNIRNTT